MNELNQNYKTLKKDYLENSNVITLNKISSHNQLNSDKIQNNKFFLLKTPMNNYKKISNKEKIKYGLLGINQIKDNKNNNCIEFLNSRTAKKIYSDNFKHNKNENDSFLSFINNVSLIKNIKQSRNYNQNKSNNSFSVNNKYRALRTMYYNYSYSKTNTLNKSSKSQISSKYSKNSYYIEQNKLNKSQLNNQKKNYNEFILNAKPIIKKQDNLINNKLWSKLMVNIDQKQNNKINKLKKKYTDNLNININTNININIKNNIINYQTGNEIIKKIEINNKENNSDNNKENMNYRNVIKTKNDSSKTNDFTNLSLNEKTNCNQLERSNSTENINKENNYLKNENKIHFNKKILEIEKEKNIKTSHDQIKQKQNYTKKKTRKKSFNDRNLIEKERKLPNKLSSNSLESNNENIFNKKKQIKYCQSDISKTNFNKNENKFEEEFNNFINQNEDNISDINEHSFIGNNNSYYRINKKSINKELSEKENNNVLSGNNKININFFSTYKMELNNKNNDIQMNIPNNSTFQSDNFKIIRLLSNNCSYNVSFREIHEETPKLFEHENPNENYHFIYEIEKNNTNIKNLNKKKFLNLKDNCIFKILSFGNDILLPLLNSDNCIKNKINKVFNNIFENIINDFKFKYKDYLEVIGFKFEPLEIITFFNKKHYILELILYCKIISKNIEESIEISCNYLANKKRYDYMWKFDLQKNSKINKWIATEINPIKNYHKSFSYISQVSSFSYGDEIQIHINIFNINNTLEPSSLEWCTPVISKVLPEIYENKKFINEIKFDPLRACEVEKQVLLWHDNLNKEQMILFEEIKEIFKDYFKIKSIQFDKSKYYFYKIIMVPIKVGHFYKNKFCSFDINIIDIETPVKNEIQCIYLINTNNYNNKMDVRIGNNLILYIIDMQIS